MNNLTKEEHKKRTMKGKVKVACPRVVWMMAIDASELDFVVVATVCSSLDGFSLKTSLPSPASVLQRRRSRSVWWS